MTSSSAKSYNNFIGGRCKTVQDIVKNIDVQGLQEDGFRVVLDGYQRWTLVRYNSEGKTQDRVLKGLFGKTVNHDTDCVSTRVDANGRRSNQNVPVSAGEGRQDDQRPVSTASKVSDVSNTSYNQLSKHTRSNVFPGVGNASWQPNSVESWKWKCTTPPWKYEDFHGVKSDAFMKWAEFDVNHQKLMKEWDKYNSQKKEQEGLNFESSSKKQIIPEIKTETKKEKQEPKNKKPATHKEQRHKKKEKIPEIPSPKTTLIEVKPAPPGDDNDDNFWDFYDQPF